MVPKMKAATISNVTFVRPAKFYFSEFSNIPHVTYFLIFLCFVYIMTVIENVLLLSVIFLVKTLHTPKYMIVFNLSLTNLCGSTAVIPKLFETFLFDRSDIVYEACLCYMFFAMLCVDVQSWTLVTMAYDRFIAICFPLRYHSILTKQAIAVMLLFLWVVLLSIRAISVGTIDRLSFCGSLVLPSFVCDPGSILPLACDITSLDVILSYVSFVTTVCLPPALIALTYICIAIALSRIASGKERLKAVKTCTSHLTLVTICFLPVFVTNIALLFTDLDRITRIINITLVCIVPPLLNPVLYSLKTEEVLNSIKKICKNMLSNVTMSNKTFTAMLAKWKVLK